MEIWEWIFLGGQGIESGSQFRLLIKNQLQKSAGNTTIYLSFLLKCSRPEWLGFWGKCSSRGIGTKTPLRSPPTQTSCGSLWPVHWGQIQCWSTLGREREGNWCMGHCRAFVMTHNTTAPRADVIPNKFPQKKKSGNLYPKAAESPDMKIPDTNVGSTFSVLQRRTKSCLTFPCHGRSPRS